ncbi:probable RNA polymerase II nuclear localization protein SLC7A6OS isoform X1 [Drosophila tropicalis]|uniref:probable RNA polymerase II nuclear localization protein SLC7A6OS isoform X1 n=1 Tax=Drosophila tropicalis TaxID=46794 RepID=UPI0035AC2259
MPAVVRIKRRIDEEPHTAFVLNGKRRRLANEAGVNNEFLDGDQKKDSENLSTVLKFAGTLKNQDDSATKQFAAARLNKATAKEIVQQKSIASSLRKDRQRLEAQHNAREQRFRIVNCLRTTLDETDLAESGANNGESSAAGGGKKDITIVDIETQPQQSQQQDQTTTSDVRQPIVHNPEQQPADSDIGYVYDLYVPENEMQADYVDMMDDNYLSICPLGELVLEDCYNDQDEEYDSEDSNQENYYTNDYPDEEDGEGPRVMGGGSDDELCQQMNRFVFDDDDDEFASSSEDEDYATYHDPYIHTIDTENDSFVDDVDFFNVDRERGSAYERYKRRIIREAEDRDSSDDEDSFESADE